MHNPITCEVVRHHEDAGLIFMARVVGDDGVNITQASISSISFKVFDADLLSEIITGTLTISAVVFDTLQTTDPRWTTDGIGYNFRHSLPATAFPDGDKTYRVEWRVTPLFGQPFWIGPLTVPTINMLTS